jgi:pimeloyl-ACP methyl ester carboxylesterase
MLVGIPPVRSGSVERDGQKIHWQEFGAGAQAVLLLPTWSIVHSDFWRSQVPYLAERYRVITFDGLGNGASDKPVDARFYGDLLFADDGAAVLDATGTQRAAVAGASQGGAWALALAARHPERVTACIFIAPNVQLAPGHPARVAAAHAFDDELPEYDGWFKMNRHYWLADFPGFLRFFFSQCFTEPNSVEQIEHFYAMGVQTTAEVLLATDGTDEQNMARDVTIEYAKRVRCPSLVLHGDGDQITPIERGLALASLTGAELVVYPGGGHEPQCRYPQAANLVIGHFLERVVNRDH